MTGPKFQKWIFGNNYHYIIFILVRGGKNHIVSDKVLR